MGAFGLFIFWIGIEWSFSRVTNFRAGASFHGSVFGHYDGNFDGFNDNDGERETRLANLSGWAIVLKCFFAFFDLVDDSNSSDGGGWWRLVVVVDFLVLFCLILFLIFGMVFCYCFEMFNRHNRAKYLYRDRRERAID